jgi:ACS family hexuronate transporter-like MFS transporter
LTQTKIRYRILALLFAATVINYLDRSIIGVLGPTLRDKVFHWSNEDYSYVTISFQAAYAIGLLGMGAFVDRFGARIGYAVSITVWGIFNLAHTLIQPSFALIGFITARFGLAIGESGNFPSCAKAVTEWFPPHQRGFATGVTNASTNVGALLAPLLVPLVVQSDGTGWQYAFLFTTFFSIIWLFAWLRFYETPERHKNVSDNERKFIKTGAMIETERKLRWREVLFVKETWAFALMKTTDAVWWFYVLWGGMFLADKFKFDIKQIGLPLIVIYVLADLGSIGGGWLSGHLMNKGLTTNRARKSTLFICALMMVPITFATRTESPWVAVLVLALGAAGHQAWSVNIFTIVSDVFPRKAVSSVIGIGGMVGSVASIAAFFTLGKTLKAGDANGYAVPFLVASSWYLTVLFFADRIMPRLTPAKLD